MTFRVLKAGGILEVDTGENAVYDMTTMAHAELFSDITLEPNVTLGDIFRLMEASPILKDVFVRESAYELCEEAAKGALLAEDLDPDDALDYIELYQMWNFHTGDNTYSQIYRLGMHAIGVPLSKDRPDMGRKAGERIEWSVSLAPLRKLLNLPVRVNTTVQALENDRDAKKYGRVLFRAENPEITLGQIIHSLFWELSFYGGPSQQAEMAAELKSRMDSVQDGTAELINHDDLFAQLELEHPLTKSMEATFESIGQYKVFEVRRALRKLEDDAPVGETLAKELGPEVVIKPEYRDMEAREFRTLLRNLA